MLFAQQFIAANEFKKARRASSSTSHEVNMIDAAWEELNKTMYSSRIALNAINILLFGRQQAANRQLPDAQLPFETNAHNFFTNLRSIRERFYQWKRIPIEQFPRAHQELFQIIINNTYPLFGIFDEVFKERPNGLAMIEESFSQMLNMIPEDLTLMAKEAIILDVGTRLETIRSCLLVYHTQVIQNIELDDARLDDFRRGAPPAPDVIVLDDTPSPLGSPPPLQMVHEIPTYVPFELDDIPVQGGQPPPNFTFENVLLLTKKVIRLTFKEFNYATTNRVPDTAVEEFLADPAKAQGRNRGKVVLTRIYNNWVALLKKISSYLALQGRANDQTILDKYISDINYTKKFTEDGRDFPDKSFDFLVLWALKSIALTQILTFGQPRNLQYKGAVRVFGVPSMVQEAQEIVARTARYPEYAPLNTPTYAPFWWSDIPPETQYTPPTVTVLPAPLPPKSVFAPPSPVALPTPPRQSPVSIPTPPRQSPVSIPTPPRQSPAPLPTPPRRSPLTPVDVPYSPSPSSTASTPYMSSPEEIELSEEDHNIPFGTPPSPDVWFNNDDTGAMKVAKMMFKNVFCTWANFNAYTNQAFIRFYNEPDAPVEGVTTVNGCVYQNWLTLLRNSAFNIFIDKNYQLDTYIVQVDERSEEHFATQVFRNAFHRLRMSTDYIVANSSVEDFEEHPYIVYEMLDKFLRDGAKRFVLDDVDKVKELIPEAVRQMPVHSQDPRLEMIFKFWDSPVNSFMEEDVYDRDYMVIWCLKTLVLTVAAYKIYKVTDQLFIPFIPLHQKLINEVREELDTELLEKDPIYDIFWEVQPLPSSTKLSEPKVSFNIKSTERLVAEQALKFLLTQWRPLLPPDDEVLEDFLANPQNADQGKSLNGRVYMHWLYVLRHSRTYILRTRNLELLNKLESIPLDSIKDQAMVKRFTAELARLHPIVRNLRADDEDPYPVYTRMSDYFKKDEMSGSKLALLKPFKEFGVFTPPEDEQDILGFFKGRYAFKLQDDLPDEEMIIWCLKTLAITLIALIDGINDQNYIFFFDESNREVIERAKIVMSDTELVTNPFYRDFWDIPAAPAVSPSPPSPARLPFSPRPSPPSSLPLFPPSKTPSPASVRFSPLPPSPARPLPPSSLPPSPTPPSPARPLPSSPAPPSPLRKSFPMTPTGISEYPTPEFNYMQLSQESSDNASPLTPTIYEFSKMRMLRSRPEDPAELAQVKQFVVQSLAMAKIADAPEMVITKFLVNPAPEDEGSVNVSIYLNWMTALKDRTVIAFKRNNQDLLYAIFAVMRKYKGDDYNEFKLYHGRLLTQNSTSRRFFNDINVMDISNLVQLVIDKTPNEAAKVELQREFNKWHQVNAESLEAARRLHRLTTTIVQRPHHFVDTFMPMTANQKLIWYLMTITITQIMHLVANVETKDIFYFNDENVIAVEPYIRGSILANSEFSTYWQVPYLIPATPTNYPQLQDDVYSEEEAEASSSEEEREDPFGEEEEAIQYQSDLSSSGEESSEKEELIDDESSSEESSSEEEEVLPGDDDLYVLKQANNTKEVTLWRLKNILLLFMVQTDPVFVQAKQYLFNNRGARVSIRELASILDQELSEGNPEFSQPLREVLQSPPETIFAKIRSLFGTERSLMFWFADACIGRDQRDVGAITTLFGMFGHNDVMIRGTIASLLGLDAGASWDLLINTAKMDASYAPPPFGEEITRSAIKPIVMYFDAVEAYILMYKVQGTLDDLYALGEKRLALGERFQEDIPKTDLELREIVSEIIKDVEGERTTLVGQVMNLWLQGDQPCLPLLLFRTLISLGTTSVEAVWEILDQGSRDYQGATIKAIHQAWVLAFLKLANVIAEQRSYLVDDPCWTNVVQALRAPAPATYEALQETITKFAYDFKSLAPTRLILDSLSDPLSWYYSMPNFLQQILGQNVVNVELMDSPIPDKAAVIAFVTEVANIFNEPLPNYFDSLDTDRDSCLAFLFKLSLRLRQENNPWAKTFDAWIRRPDWYYNFPKFEVESDVDLLVEKWSSNQTLMELLSRGPVGLPAFFFEQVRKTTTKEEAIRAAIEVLGRIDDDNTRARNLAIAYIREETPEIVVPPLGESEPQPFTTITTRSPTLDPFPNSRWEKQSCWADSLISSYLIPAAMFASTYKPKNAFYSKLFDVYRQHPTPSTEATKKLTDLRTQFMDELSEFRTRIDKQCDPNETQSLFVEQTIGCSLQEWEVKDAPGNAGRRVFDFIVPEPGLVVLNGTPDVISIRSTDLALVKKAERYIMPFADTYRDVTYRLASLILYDGLHYRTWMFFTNQTPAHHFLELGDDKYAGNQVWLSDPLASQKIAKASISRTTAINSDSLALMEHYPELLTKTDIKDAFPQLFTPGIKFKPVQWIYVRAEPPVGSSTFQFRPRTAPPTPSFFNMLRPTTVPQPTFFTMLHQVTPPPSSSSSSGSEGTTPRKRRTRRLAAPPVANSPASEPEVAPIPAKAPSMKDLLSSVKKTSSSSSSSEARPAPSMKDLLSSVKKTSSSSSEVPPPRNTVYTSTTQMFPTKRRRERVPAWKRDELDTTPSSSDIEVVPTPKNAKKKPPTTAFDSRVGTLLAAANFKNVIPLENGKPAAIFEASTDPVPMYKWNNLSCSYDCLFAAFLFPYAQHIEVSNPDGAELYKMLLDKVFLRNEASPSAVLKQKEAYIKRVFAQELAALGDAACGLMNDPMLVFHHLLQDLFQTKVTKDNLPVYGVKWSYHRYTDTPSTEGETPSIFNTVYTPETTGDLSNLIIIHTPRSSEYNILEHRKIPFMHYNGTQRFRLSSVILYNGIHFRTLVFVSHQSPARANIALSGSRYLQNGVWFFDNFVDPFLLYKPAPQYQNHFDGTVNDAVDFMTQTRPNEFNLASVIDKLGNEQPRSDEPSPDAHYTPVGFVYIFDKRIRVTSPTKKKVSFPELKEIAPLIPPARVYIKPIDTTFLTIDKDDREDSVDLYLERFTETPITYERRNSYFMLIVTPPEEGVQEFKYILPMFNVLSVEDKKVFNDPDVLEQFARTDYDGNYNIEDFYGILNTDNAWFLATKWVLDLIATVWDKGYESYDVVFAHWCYFSYFIPIKGWNQEDFDFEEDMLAELYITQNPNLTVSAEQAVRVRDTLVKYDNYLLKKYKDMPRYKAIFVRADVTDTLLKFTNLVALFKFIWRKVSASPLSNPEFTDGAAREDYLTLLVWLCDPFFVDKIIPVPQ